MAAVVIRTVEENSRSFLMNLIEMEKTNAVGVVIAIDDSMKMLFDSGVPRDDVLMLVTDAASYMILAGKIQIYYIFTF